MADAVSKQNIDRVKAKGVSFFFKLASLITGIVFLLPLFWLILCSFKTEEEIFKVPVVIFPSHLYIQPYLDQLTGYYNMATTFLNSVIIAVSTMCLSILLSTLAAYGLSRYAFRGRHLLVLSFLVTQMLPASLLLTPLFIIFKNLNFLNNYISPVIADATIAIPFTVLIMRTYFLSIPKQLEEAAYVDGCGPFDTFLRIFLPNVFPGVVVSAIFAFLFAWNDLIYANTFMNKHELMPMTAGIYNFMGQYGTSWNRIMAFGVVTVIPVVVIFIAMQRYIISGLTSGSIKG
jgi:multiple sugar transport system permease protein